MAEDLERYLAAAPSSAAPDRGGPSIGPAAPGILAEATGVTPCVSPIGSLKGRASTEK
jgi:hypothetical protein